MKLGWPEAMKAGRRMLEDPTCEVLYIDPRFGTVLRMRGFTLSVRPCDQWAWVDGPA